MVTSSCQCCQLSTHRLEHCSSPCLEAGPTPPQPNTHCPQLHCTGAHSRYASKHARAPTPPGRPPTHPPTH